MSNTMAYLLNVLLVFVEVFALYQLGCTFFEQKRRGWTMAALIAALAVLHIAILLVSGGNLLIKLPLFVILDTFWLLLVFRPHVLKCLLVSVLFSSVMMLGDSVIYYGVAALLGQDTQVYMQNPYAYYAFCYAVKIIELLIITLLRMCLKNRSFLRATTWKDWTRIIIFPLTATVIALALLRIYTDAPDAAPHILLCSAILVVADVLSIVLLHYIERQKQMLDDYAILNRTMKLEQNNVTAWMDAYAAQRRQTHEYHNQLEVIRGMAQRDGNGEVADYVSKLLQSQTKEDLPVSTGRTVVDVILNQKNAIARSKEIEFYVNLDDLSGFALPDDALTVVLSNLIDNAIEASEKLADPAQRVIRLNMRVEPEASFLYIENRTAAPVKIVDNRVATTKNDVASHGYGLKNVAAIMEQYGAEYVLDYQEDAGLFCFSAQMIPSDH